MKRRHHPEDLAEALKARFPAPYSLTFEQIAEAVLDELAPAAEPEPEDGKLTPEQAKALLEEVDLPQPYPGVPAGKRQLFEQKRCSHCQGLHTRKCPAVKEISYHPDGKVARVIYFRHGEWPEDEVLWLEDVIEAAEADDEQK